MTSAVLAVIAALGASFLTGLASIGVVLYQQWLRSKSDDEDALAGAVIEMLSRSMAISMRAHTLAETMRIRSGLGEGADVVAGLRKPMDLLEIHDWMAQDMAPLSAAWSVVWARGDQEMVRLANALLSACSDLIGTDTAVRPAASLLERVRRHVVGERWTPEQRAESDRAMKTVAHARKELAQHARRMLGKSHVELLGHGQENGEPGEVSAALDAAGQE